MEKKKKKKSENIIKDCLRTIRSKVPMNNFNSRVSLGASDARRAKRVRFEEPDTMCPLTSKPNALSTNASRIHPPKCDDPKTSEYAFYKKLREDAAHSSHSYQIPKEHKHLEKPEACNRTKEWTKPNNEIKSSSPVEKGAPIALVSPFPPRVSKNSGPEFEHEDIFSIKRQKLLHLVVEASSLDIDKLCSKGYDLVPMLLQRLHPESNEIAETSCSMSRSRSANTRFNSKSQLHVSLKSDIHSEEFPQTPSMNLISPFAGKNLRNDLLESWPNKSRDYNRSQEVGEDLGSLLTWHPRNLLECERRLPGDIVDCGEPSSLHFEKVPRTPSKNLISPFSGKNFKNGLLNSWSNKFSEYHLSQEVGEDLGSLLTWHPNNVLLECERRPPDDIVDCGEPSSLYIEEVPRTPSMNLISPFVGKNFKSGVLEPWSNTSRECDLSQEIGKDAGSLLTWHPNEFLECERRQPDDITDCGGTSSLQTKRDAAFGVQQNKEFSFNKDEYLALDYRPNQSRLFSPTYKTLYFESGSPDKSLSLNSRSSFKESDDLCCPNRLASGSNKWAQFMGWCTNTVEKEQYLNSSSGAVPNISLTWRTPSEDDSNLNCIFDVTGMHFPSTRGIRHWSDITLGNMSSGSYLSDTVGRRVLEDREYQVEDPDEFPLPLCCTPKYLGLEEKCRLSNMVQETSIFHSPLIKNRFMSKIFGDRFPRLGSQLQSSLDFDYGCDSLPASDYLKELQLSTRCDLQICRKDSRGASGFLVGRDVTERCMDNLINTEDQTHLAKDLCQAYDLTSLSFKIPLNKEFHPLFLDEPSSNESFGDHNGDDVGQLLLMDSML